MREVRHEISGCAFLREQSVILGCVTLFLVFWEVLVRSVTVDDLSRLDLEPQG